MEQCTEDGEDLAAKESSSDSSISAVKQKPVLLSYGFLSKVHYVHKSKNSTILSVSYNSKTCEYIIADSLGISAWKKGYASAKTSKLVQYSPHNFNFIKILLYCRSVNMYFALTKAYVLKIYNLNFHETFSIESDVNALIHMVFNTLTNELITASRSEIYIWTFGQFVKQSGALAKNFGLVLKLKWQVDGGRLINRITLDEEAQRLYCLSETNVWCYDVLGRLLFIVKRACSTHLSACAYSSNTVIAGSVDGQVSFLTTSGGKIHTFFSHSNLITEILIHPCDNQMIITASLDGYIKLFSLELVEELYSVKVFEDGIEYMALKSSDILYCVSTKDIEEFDLNYLCQFWGQLRYPAQSIEVITSGEKSNRVMILDSDNTIKLFSTREKRKLCTVLPPPTVDLSNTVLPCVHDIDYNLIYFLVNSSEVWVYTTKTDPACFLAAINLLEDGKSGKASRVTSPTFQDAPGVVSSVKPKCLCIEIIPDFFKFQFVDADGVVQTNCNLLGCGMDNGHIVLFNPIMKGRKENSLQICINPIVQLKFCKEILSCVVTTKAKDGLHIRIINADLETCVLMTCDDDVTTSAIKGATLALGFASGHMIIQEQLLEQQKVMNLNKHSSADHNNGVLSISFHPTLDILCSAGRDCCVKIWSIDRHLLCEISLDSSLTSVCFLNSLGDMLIGFKGHVFSIRNGGKYKWLQDTVDEVDRPLSQIYESPGLRYDAKHSLSPDVETMDKYLVPYNDMIFMTVGTWIIKNEDAPSTNDFEDASFGGGSDEDSVAPSDIYQSSVFSLGSSGTMQWALPDCGLTPEGSVDGESWDEDNSETLEIEAENKIPVNSSDDVVSKTGLDKVLIKEDESEDSMALYMPEFAHSSSERLLTRKIDIKKVKIVESTKQGKGGKEGTSRAVQDHVISKENKATKEPVVKEDKQRVAKKTRKPVTERKRATSRTPTAKTSSPDNGSETKAPVAEGMLDLSQEVNADKEVAVLTPDDVKEGSLLGVDHLQGHGGPEPEEPEAEEQVTVLAKNVIQLKKVTVAAKGVIRLKRGAVQIAEDGRSHNRGEKASESGSEDQRHLQEGSKSIDLDEVGAKGHLDAMNARDDSPACDSANAKLQSGLSPVPSQFSKYSDVLSDSVVDVGDRDTPLGNRGNTFHETADAGIAKTKGVSPTLLSILKQKPKSSQSSKDAMNVKVVPSYSQEAIQSNSTLRSNESSHGSVADLAVKSERMRVHDTRGVYLLRKRKQFEFSNMKSEDRRPVFQRRRSQAVRIAFGGTLDQQEALSLSSVAIDKSKISVDADVYRKVEKDPDELLKFCTSAFKKHLTGQRNLSSTILSAGASESRVSGEARLVSAGVNEEELRPRTAPVLNRPGSSTEEKSSAESKGPIRKKMELPQGGRDQLQFLEKDLNRLSDNDSSSGVNDKHKVNATMKQKDSKPGEFVNQQYHAEHHGIPQIQTRRRDDRLQQERLPEHMTTHKEEAADFKGRSQLYGVYKRSIARQSPMNELTKSGTDSSYVHGGAMQKTCDERQERKGSVKIMQNMEDINAPNAIRQSDGFSKEGITSVPIKMETIQTGFSQKSSFTRDSPTGKVLYVDIPSDNVSSGETANDSDVERFSPGHGVRREKHKRADRATVVLSPQEKLLKHRAASADMKRRQDNARFRRKAIEQQRRARTQNRSASPAYTQDYLLDYLSDAEEELPPSKIYDYNKPTPLYRDGKLIKSEETKVEGTKQDRSLLARLSGQAFRYGRVISKDNNEDVTVQFIRTVINKKSGDIVLLPLQKSKPSIPTKCRNYILITQQKNEGVKMSKVEKELLESRFRRFYSPVS